MNTSTVEVGAWVRTRDGREGLVIAYHCFSQFFTVEFEDGSRTVERAEWLEVVTP